jgi:hypothetical protein
VCTEWYTSGAYAEFVPRLGWSVSHERFGTASGAMKIEGTGTLAGGPFLSDKDGLASML